MGFGFRKSFSSGPFRFTLSKSGISSSFGVKGARVTMGPRGTHISVGSHGFYYRERIGPSRESRNRKPYPGPASDTQTADGEIPTAKANDLVDSSSEQLLFDLNRRAKMFNFGGLLWLIALGCLIGSAIGNAVVLLPATFIVGAVAVSANKVIGVKYFFVCGQLLFPFL
jgi:Protein of unknown function (DUF4236)